MSCPKAKVLKTVPPDRVESSNGSQPQVGDIVEVDQGFALGETGENAYLVICCDAEGRIRWRADMLEPEFEMLRDL